MEKGKMVETFMRRLLDSTPLLLVWIGSAGLRQDWSTVVAVVVSVVAESRQKALMPRCDKLVERVEGMGCSGGTADPLLLLLAGV